MKTSLVLVMLSIALIIGNLPSAKAAGAISGGESAGSSCESYYHMGILSVAAAINAGDIETWSSVPGCGIARSNTQVLQWSGRMTGPVILGTATTSAWSIAGVNGCTVSAVTNLIDMGAAATGISGTAQFTMTSPECHAIATFTLTITVAAVTVFQTRPEFDITIRTEQPNYSFLCAATEVTANAYAPGTNVCQEPQINNLNYLCAATGAVPDSFNEASTTCNTPTQNVVNSGTITGDNLNRLCAASTIGSACTTPNLNVAVTSWPTLTLSGTIATVQSGSTSQTVTFANALTVHQDPLSGDVTIHDDSNGWIVHQDAVTGSLTIHQDEACGAVTHCKVDISGIDLGNVSVNSTNKNDFADVILDWFPLWFGLIGLFVAIWRREGVEPNALIGAGVAMFVACFTCPFPAWTDPIGLVYRILVVTAGIWMCLKWAEYSGKGKDVKQIE